MPVIFRFGFIPLFLFANYEIESGERKMPLLLVNDHVYVLATIVFAFTGGYFATLSMMFAPR